MKLQKTGNQYSLLFLLVGLLIFSSCARETSNATGWEYNNQKNGGFQKAPFIDQETGPGLVLIEGGRFTMGRTEQDVMYDWNNVPRTVTVPSFYMDETEVTNLMYVEYLFWLERVYIADYPEVFRRALPDTLVWRSKLGYNEPYVEYYLRHPAYRDYPVVGVNWLQATDFCAWRTDRVNERILIREGLFEDNPSQLNEDNFNTDAYLAGQYESGKRVDGIPDFNPNKEFRNVLLEDGILLPKYRLPTEAEWEYAAYGLIGRSAEELVKERQIYPWRGHGIRNSDPDYLGQILANFKRGRGDNMGVAGALNDNADVTAPVYSYWPNDYGLYNMAGNVSEWVMDVYRPLTGEDADEFRPFRGNVYKTKQLDEDGVVMDKDSLGRLIYRDVDPQLDNLQARRNYKQADNIDYADGHWESNINYASLMENPSSETSNQSMYQFGETSLINDQARVYKGASWKDRAYYAVPGTRRYITEDQATDYIGFRCAMDRIGSTVGRGF